MVSLVVRGAERLRLSRDSRIAHRARARARRARRRYAHARDAMCRVIRACRARLRAPSRGARKRARLPRPHAIAARIARMKDLQRAV
ncbi:hypothetical protein BURMUCF2_B0159 [Burkholderia multivorans CF2]|nr:hypothetical protein BURMUCF2_B0159 [Burkholderia multivorans CF2]